MTAPAAAGMGAPEWRRVAVITAAAAVLFFVVRRLPTGTNLSHIDFRVGGNSIEFCDPANPQFLPVVAVRACPVARLVTVTVALGITAPEESFTVPVIAPVVADWPMSTGADNIDASARAKQVTAKAYFRHDFKIFLMCSPCLFSPTYTVLVVKRS